MDTFFFSYEGQLVLNWSILAVAALGFRWTYLAGQFSMGHAAIMGVGAYGAAKFAIAQEAGMAVAMAVGIGCAVLTSVVMGLLSLRLDDMFLSIGSLAVGFSIIGLIDHSDSLGGPTGLTPPFLVGPYTILATLAVVFVVSLVIDATRFGRSCRAVADDSLVAGSSGVDIRAIRMLAWVLGGLVVGTAGTLFALSLGSISPLDFGFDYLILMLIAVLAGGAGTPVGPLLGAAFVIALPEVVRQFDVDRGLVYGPVIVLLVLLRPNGLLPEWPSVLRRKPTPGQIDLAELFATPEREQSDDRSPVLSVQDVSIAFGGIKALDHVSFDVKRGTVFGLIGPNGAGKTTLVNIITGALRPNGGSVTFGGRDVIGMRPYARARMGLSRTFQAPRLLPSLSLERNASIGQWSSVRPAHGRKPIDPDLLLEMMGLAELVGRKVNSLNLAEQRRVEIARALATNPELVLLDEPTAGMNHVEAYDLIKLVVTACKHWGITVLLIEHNMNIVMGFSDEILVVSFGKQIAAGTPAEIKADQTVIDAYLGSHV